MNDLSPKGINYHRNFLTVLLIVWGMQAIVTQSLLLREAVVLMFGSEFAWGIVLFAWLLGVAVGAVIGGWIAERVRHADLALVAVLLALSVACCAELWLFRGGRAFLGVQTGELLPLTKTALAALLFVSPASALVGVAFPLACCVGGGGSRSAAAGSPGPAALGLGDVYALESAGSLLGGTLFSFWAVEHLTPIQIALTCGALSAAASACLLFANGRRLVTSGLFALVALAAILTSGLAGDALNDRLIQRRWRNTAPGYELCAEAETKRQNLSVGRLGEQYTLYTDGQVSADFPDPYTFAPLAHFWMCQHPAPRRVLLLGGGAEGLLAEILRHPVEHVDYVEPDPRQIELIEPFLTDQDRMALADARTTVHNMDARYFVKTQADRFDLVIARLPEPTSALRARLYTREFFGELRRAMSPQSVLCMTAAATPGGLSAASAEYLASIRATLNRAFPHITIGWGNPAHILAATEVGLVATDPSELQRRYAERGVSSDVFHPDWFEGATDWLDPAKIEQRAAELESVDEARISTDLHPFVYVQRLALWEKMTSVRSPRVFEFLESIGWLEVLGFLLVTGAVTLLWCYARTTTSGLWFANGAVTLSIGSTGFVTMALSVVWLFAFQNLYGYVYQRIGWIVALFMAGLVVGCTVIGWASKRCAGTERFIALSWQRLVLVDVLMAVLALATPTILVNLAAMQSGPTAFVIVEWCISGLVLLTGVLGGAAFALAGGLRLSTTARPGAAAGSVVGADHAGACLGALLCGILLVPIFGTPATALLLAGIKLSSVALLLFVRRGLRAA